MAPIALSIKHLKKPAHQVASTVIKAIENNVRRQRWLMLLQYHSKNDVNLASVAPEALHDFRVELRRLRVWLAQSRDCVASRRPARRQLRVLAKASNAPRDFEVFLSLLDQITPAVTHVIAAKHATLAELKAPLPALLPRRRKQKSKPFGLWLREHLEASLQQCDRCLNGNEACLHEARIHIKHLRYLLEPLAELPVVAAAIVALKSLQTTLGDLHDLYQMRPLITPWICTQLGAQLNEHANLPVGETTQIQQIFNSKRDAFISVLSWQAARYQAALHQWDAQAASHRQMLDTKLRAVINFLGADGQANAEV
jgi:CHAD domain-containing protein